MYGDKESYCDTIQIQDCTDSRTQQDCCETCSYYKDNGKYFHKYFSFCPFFMSPYGTTVRIFTNIFLCAPFFMSPKGTTVNISKNIFHFASFFMSPL